MWMGRLMAAAAAFAWISLSPGEAKAALYVCGTSYLSSSSNFGTDGYIWFTLYSGSNCSGTLNGTYFLCSAGATSNSCAASATYRYSAAGLVAMFEALRRASGDNMRVDHAPALCNGGGVTCGSVVQFFAN
jgi:hypothetical protein